MSNELPLKIRADIRDLWDSPKSSLQPSIEALTKTLGLKIVPQVQWPPLWAALKDHFSDKSTFVPTTLHYVTVWYDQLNWRLDNEVAPEWTEEILTLLTQAARGSEILLQIEVSETSKRPHTYWESNLKVFRLGVPNAKPATQSQLSSGFESDFQNLLSGSQTTGVPQKAAIVEDGWADVEEPEIQAPEPPLSRRPPASHPTIPEALGPKPFPVINALTRPNDLFAKTAPYILIVDTGNPLIVQSSHQPSLELLAAYLNKWGKPNRNDGQKRNILSVELLESEFAVGVIDALRIEPHISFGRMGPVNPTIILAFIEGVLGYNLVHTTGGRFVYRSDAIFK